VKKHEARCSHLADLDGIEAGGSGPPTSGRGSD